MRITWALALLGGCGIENTIVPGHATDTFTQEEAPTVDILFVVDDSSSMKEEQAALSAGFQTFVRQMEQAASDFHIGVISTSQDTTDPNRGHLLGDPAYLTPQDDYVTLFHDRIASIGVAGSSKEKGLEAASYALSPDMLIGPNTGFLRADANLLVVIVSDEDDCSDDGALDGQDPDACYTERDVLVPVDFEVARIVDAKNDGELVQIAGIVGPFDDTCADAYPGRRYVEAALQTGKICDSDWTPMLDSLGLNAVGIVDTFKLSNAADLSTMVVTVDGATVPQDQDAGWTYDWTHTTVTFHGAAVPAAGSVIVIDYDIAPSY
jgi:hypothetical protein